MNPPAEVSQFVPMMRGIETRPSLETRSGAVIGSGVATPHGPSSSLVSFAFSGGARFVLSSLWTASDDITADLMARFYANVAAGMDAVNALHEAKLAVRRSAGRLHPHYLANFRLTRRNAQVISWRLAKEH